VGTANTSPSNFISSGTQIKHTTNSSGSFSVTIPNPECPTITVSDGGSLNSAALGVPSNIGTFTASPAPAGTYSFTASGLPSWASLDPSTGLLTATPPQDFSLVGTTVSFTVTATDSGGNPAGCTGQAQFSFDVICPDIFVNIAPSTLPPAIVGQLYTIHLSASPAGNYTFSSDNDTPSWLSIDPVTGVLSGTPGPGDTGFADFIVTATEASGCAGGNEVAFSVAPAALVAQVPTLGGLGFALLALSLAGAAFLLIRRG
jgi:hypothetical protein